MNETDEAMRAGNRYPSRRTDPSAAGMAVAQLIAAGCVLASDGALNVSTSLVGNTGGVDLVFHRRGRQATLAVQLKAASSDTYVVQRGRFVTPLRTPAYPHRGEFHWLFAVVDRPTVTVNPVWLVPGVVLDAEAADEGRRRFAASLQGQQDKWHPYRMRFRELPPAILHALDQLEASPTR